MTRYVSAHLDTRSVVSLSRITNAMLKYATAYVGEVANGGIRVKGFSMSAALVDWYLAAFGVKACLANDVGNLRYVSPREWRHREIGSTGDVVASADFSTVMILGSHGALSYSETLRTSVVIPTRIPTRFDFKLQTYNIYPKRPALLPEEVYEQCKESYTLRGYEEVGDQCESHDQQPAS